VFEYIPPTFRSHTHTQTTGMTHIKVSNPSYHDNITVSDSWNCISSFEAI